VRENGGGVRTARICAMNRNRSSLGKRPREAFAEEATPEAHKAHEFTPSTEAAQHAEHAHNSPLRHTPGVTPGACGTM
jgi:hypothetical protein